MVIDAKQKLLRRKIFPRNLTARADTVVRGNPANARPESGVDNTHPGLEFDQRNLDKVFFPGLVFEFHYLLGAKLAEVHPELFVHEFGLRAEDADGEIYLWYVFGAFGAQPQQRRLVDLFGLDGYEVLRTVHDLEPGTLVVIVGRSPDLSDLGQVKQWMGVGMDFSKLIAAGGMPELSRVRRDDKGRLLFAVLVGKRADYLDDGGVIALDAVPSGALTRSLCAPWQWDFADCGCHYWAANKPDIVMAQEGEPQALNFQRNRAANGGTPDRPTAHDTWIAGAMTQPQMVLQWETLPFVIAEHEATSANLPTPHEVKDPWSRAKIIEELTYLAGVEHALCIEFLYAHYSLNAPADQNGLAGQDLDVFRAAHEVFTIAKDEMRHFRWVNEALQLLGAPLCLDRAEGIGRQQRQVRGQFELAPLTPERLDFFIAVEAPSRSINHPEEPDGLYTHMLLSLHQRPEDYDSILRQRIIEIVKLIIDEGQSHWERFGKIKTLLASYKPGQYLRLKGSPQPAPDPENKALQDLADSYYHTLLSGLGLAFSKGERSRGGLLEQAIRSMRNLHDVGHLLANRGVGLLFTMPIDLEPGLEFSRATELGSGASTTVADLAFAAGGAVVPAPQGPLALSRARPALLRGRMDQLRAYSSKLLKDLVRSENEHTQRLASRHVGVL